MQGIECYRAAAATAVLAAMAGRGNVRGIACCEAAAATALSAAIAGRGNVRGIELQEGYGEGAGGLARL